MKAFLSHSSKDKAFVETIANELGAECEYDEHTFEYELNTVAIQRALGRSDVFVLFLSQSSVNSPFVSEELRQSLERRSRGLLSKILIIAIDDTSFTKLPQWIRDINIARKLKSPRACARQIQAALLGTAAEKDSHSDIYVGREIEIKQLRNAISQPPSSMPTAIHIVGHVGIGRKTFLTRCFQSSLPRLNPVPITISQYDGPEELFRTLYALHIVSSKTQSHRDFRDFANLNGDDKISRITAIVEQMSDQDEYLLVSDDNGVYDDSGYYHDFLHKLVTSVKRRRHPVFAFIQTRMMPYSKRFGESRWFHIKLNPLNDEEMSQLMRLLLNHEQVEFDANKIEEIAKNLDGHPYNAKFALGFCLTYGVDALFEDPTDLLEWKQRRAEDFLQKINFSDVDIDILSVLQEYRYIAAETLNAALSGRSIADIRSSLRALEDLCCIERQGSHFHISSPIRDSIGRDKRFNRSRDWRQKIAVSICDGLNDYSDDDQIPIAILADATAAAARAPNPPEFLSNLILPSHLLRIARDLYDRNHRRDCMTFCQKAYEMRDRLTSDATVEVLRLWGLSAIRTGPQQFPDYKRVLDGLSRISSKIARRTSFFLQGFQARMTDRPDEAEEKFLKAYDLSPRNQSICRELGQLYCSQQRYVEAERYAREAYEIAPTNPFIIDVLLEALIGAAGSGSRNRDDEIARLFDELRSYGDRPGSSFFLLRQGHLAMIDRKYPLALERANQAVEQTPSLVKAYLLRAEALIGCTRAETALNDLTKCRSLIEEGAGVTDGLLGKIEELEIIANMELERISQAYTTLTMSQHISKSVRNSLSRDLIALIAERPQLVEERIRQWARRFQ